jgi:hypothetical protein
MSLVFQRKTESSSGHTKVYRPYASPSSNVKDAKGFLGVNRGSEELAIQCQLKQMMLEV